MSTEIRDYRRHQSWTKGYRAGVTRTLREMLAGRSHAELDAWLDGDLDRWIEQSYPGDPVPPVEKGPDDGR